MYGQGTDSMVLDGMAGPVQKGRLRISMFTTPEKIIWKGTDGATKTEQKRTRQVVLTTLLRPVARRCNCD